MSPPIKRIKGIEIKTKREYHHFEVIKYILKQKKHHKKRYEISKIDICIENKRVIKIAEIKRIIHLMKSRKIFR